MRLLLLSVFLLCVNFSMAQKGSSVKMSTLEGTWFVNLSNFPMWLDGERNNPKFTYSRLTDEKFLDVVSFDKNGKTKTIKGFDKRAKEGKGGFVWKGKGLLFPFKSYWKVVHFNTQYQIAVLKFEKTLVSPAGYDVISKTPNLTPAALEFVNQKLVELGITAVLTVVPQN